MQFFGYWTQEQSGDTFRKNLEIGTAFIINFANGAIRAFLRKFYNLWLIIVENIISWRWTRLFARFISTPQVQENFSEIKILELRAGAKRPKFTLLSMNIFSLSEPSLTGGEVHDSKLAIRLLSKITLEGKKILADKAFCADEIREYISQENAIACIPDKSNAVVTHDFDAELYKARNIIERFFQRIKTFRHIATRYDKLSDCFLNFVFLAAVMIQI